MGPLAGLKIVEVEGIGPAPMCAMMLADLGATVLRICRTSEPDLGVKRPLKFKLTLRNRLPLALDLKMPDALQLLLKLIGGADALIEGFRPGVAERLGFGPDVCLASNPRLVYGRVTGWGQDGPLAMVAGHDLNYIALTGALHAIGRQGHPPTPPLALVGDFAGGAQFLCIGMLSALWEARASGKGQVVDAAVTDGVAALLASTLGMVAAGIYRDERGTNTSDSGAFFYDCYECSDGHWISVACVERRFYDRLLEILNINPASMPDRENRELWPIGRQRLADVFAQKTRQEWCELLEGTETCFAPVLSLKEAPKHPHNIARKSFVEVDGILHPSPAPKFSRTKPDTPRGPRGHNDTPAQQALNGWLSPDEIAALVQQGTVRNESAQNIN